MTAKVRTVVSGEPVLTVGDVARICEVAPRTVCRWIDTGLLKGYRVALTKARRVRRCDLAAFMDVWGMPEWWLGKGEGHCDG